MLFQFGSYFYFIIKESLFTVCIYVIQISKLDKINTKTSRRTGEWNTPIGGTPKI